MALTVVIAGIGYVVPSWRTPYRGGRPKRLPANVKHSFHRAQNFINLILMAIDPLICAPTVPRSAHRVSGYMFLRSGSTQL